ncbi:MAG: glycoside hydrolase family 2 TIM barrel-domain containing protein [Bryobacteraceae bacterium]
MRIPVVAPLAAVLLAGGIACYAQQIGLVQNAAARQNLSLNGPWKIIVDPYEAGYYDFHLHPIPDGGLGADRVPADKSDRLENTFLPNTPTLQVPGDWNTQKPEFLWYEGTIWYKREFDYAKQPGRRLFLWFGAANYQAIVFLNGKKLGQHEGGFTPFQFEVTDAVRNGKNSVIVKVDDQRHADAIPPGMTDWWNYGGLTRDVKLIDVPETFIQDYFVQLEKGSLNRIAGWVRLDGAHKRQKIAVRVPEAGASITVDTDENGYARFAFDATLTPWSPESPKLYDVRVEAESDRVEDRIGFRTIETAGQKLLLNGKPIFLRGISIHGEAPFRAGRVFSEADARVLLTWAKELGCNFVRLAHYPHDEAMTRLADRMGLLVWSEIPVYWVVQWENPAAYSTAERMLGEMIARDHNRASVIFWSMANETPLGDARTKFIGSLANKARELDPTRLITAALLTYYADPATIMIDDPLGKYLDVLGCNEYIGWYDGLPAKADTVSFKTVYDKPMVMSELGGGAPFGRHGDEDTAWTEEYQANVYRHQIPMLKRIPFLQGMTPWILVDFRCPRRFLTGIQDYYNRKGLLSDRGERKQAYYILRDYYQSLAGQK